MLDPKYSEEVIFVRYNFYDMLQAGETISSATFYVTISKGTDSSVSAMLSGSATVNGSIANQKIITGVKGNQYKIKAVCPTSMNRTVAYEDTIEII